MERADKPRPEKAKVVDGLKEKFANAAGVFIADYRGLTVEQVNNLRKAFRTAGVDYRVVGDLANTDRVMRDTFWIGVWPGLSDPMLDWMEESVADFFAARVGTA